MFAQIAKRRVKDRIQALRPKPEDKRPKAALISGAGAPPGIGAAVAQRIARGGMRVYVTGRNAKKVDATVKAITEAGGEALGLSVDAADESQIIAAFERIDADDYGIDLVVHNVGTNQPTAFLKITPELLEKSWRADCLSGFFMAQQAIERMQERGRGTIIFTGASASLRGKANFGAFAAAKAGLRSLAQALAREFGPKGIHVAHVVIDGAVDGIRLQQLAPQWLEGQGEDGTLAPAAIAENYWMLYQQQRSAWTHELDLRPHKETW